MHAIGFDNHWLVGPEIGIPSVMAPRESAARAFDYTAWDAAAIGIFYDPRLPPGLMRGAALTVVNLLVADWHGTIKAMDA